MFRRGFVYAVAFLFLATQAYPLSPASSIFKTPAKKSPSLVFAVAAGCLFTALGILLPGCSSIRALSDEEIRSRVHGDLKFFVQALKERRRNPLESWTVLGILRDILVNEIRYCNRRILMWTLRELEPLFVEERERGNQRMYLRLFEKLKEVFPEDVRELEQRNRAQIEEIERPAPSGSGESGSYFILPRGDETERCA